MLSAIQKANLKFILVGLFKIRIIGFVGLKLVEFNDQRTVIKVPLNWRTRNHLGSIYVGALATAADVAGAWIAFSTMDDFDKKVSVVFKDMNAEFLKRADGDVHMICEDGEKIKAGFLETIADGERKNIPISVNAVLASKQPEEVAATFKMTLSMRHRKMTH